MATNTTNYNLKKPAATDFYNVADQNENMDLIDAALKGLADGKASLGADGKVPSAQLPEMNYAPTTHAAQHASGGSDPVTPVAIGAAAAGHTHTLESIGAAAAAHDHDGRYFTKEQSLSAATAEQLGSVATPDEALDVLTTLVLNGSSCIFIKISTTSGVPVDGASVALDSAVDIDKSPITNENGICIIPISASGQHIVNFAYPFGWSGKTVSKTVSVKSGGLGVIFINDVTETLNSEVLRINNSKHLRLRPNTNFQAFLVGGGGSGSASLHNMVAAGGGGGFTLTKGFLSKNGVYTAVIGAGGASAQAVGMSDDFNGNTGGSSSLTGSNLNITANGGDGGCAGIARTDYSYSTGGRGGSGGGSSCIYSSDSSRHSFNGASDGAGDGATNGWVVSQFGIGQLTTTRAFGDASGELYSGGGGGAAFGFDGGGNSGSGGSGGGGRGAISYSKDSSGAIATAGLNGYGGGGGGAASCRGNEYTYGPATSGAGGSGVILIRRSV